MLFDILAWALDHLVDFCVVSCASVDTPLIARVCLLAGFSTWSATSLASWLGRQHTSSTTHWTPSRSTIVTKHVSSHSLHALLSSKPTSSLSAVCNSCVLEVQTLHLIVRLSGHRASSASLWDLTILFSVEMLPKYHPLHNVWMVTRCTCWVTQIVILGDNLMTVGVWQKHNF